MTFAVAAGLGDATAAATLGDATDDTAGLGLEAAQARSLAGSARLIGTQRRTA
jgi:hypothetical protein